MGFVCGRILRFLFHLFTNICSSEKEAPRTKLEKAKKGTQRAQCDPAVLSSCTEIYVPADLL